MHRQWQVNVAGSFLRPAAFGSGFNVALSYWADTVVVRSRRSCGTSEAYTGATTGGAGQQERIPTTVNGTLNQKREWAGLTELLGGRPSSDDRMVIEPFLEIAPCRF
jgi:hypothetical protein